MACKATQWGTQMPPADPYPCLHAQCSAVQTSSCLPFIPHRRTSSTCLQLPTAQCSATQWGTQMPPADPYPCLHAQCRPVPACPSSLIAGPVPPACSFLQRSANPASIRPEAAAEPPAELPPWTSSSFVVKSTATALVSPAMTAPRGRPIKQAAAQCCPASASK